MATVIKLSQRSRTESCVVVVTHAAKMFFGLSRGIFQVFFTVSLFSDFGGPCVRSLGWSGCRRHRDDPRSVLRLVPRVPRLVVSCSCVSHLPEDLQPPLTKATEGTGMALAFLALLLVVNLSPGAVESAQVCPQMHGGPKGLVAPPGGI